MTGSIDIIGTLYSAPADPEAVPEALPGWHANVTPEMVTPDLKPYVVTPSRLRRVWAGDDPVEPQITVALRFADEAEGMAVLAPYLPQPE